MTNKNLHLVKSYILDYLKLRFPETNTKGKMFRCPFGEEHEGEWDKETCNIFPKEAHTLHCYDPKHGKIGDIFALVKRCEPNMADLSNEDIADYLASLLNIKTDSRIQKILEGYSNAGFCLIPLKKQNNGKESKEALKGGWEKSEYRDMRQWADWLDTGLGLGLNLGAKSNVIAIDIDSMATYELVKHMLVETAHQKTKRGFGHLLFSYDKDFDHINHANLRYIDKKYEMEVRANNAYIVVAPTSVEGEIREWNSKPIVAMPAELKKFLLDMIGKEKPDTEPDDLIQKCIDAEKLDVIDLSGQRNDTFIKTAGVFRKWMNRATLEKTLSFLSSNWIDKPIPIKELKAILSQVEKYNTFDKKDIATKIMKHLGRTTQTTARDLQAILGYDLNDIHEALHYLLQEEKIYQLKSVYHLVEKFTWTTEFVDKSKVLPFKVPYFENYHTSRSGDLIVIGGMPGVGKTHVAMNFVKGFVDQKVMPNYVPTEAGSRWARIAMELNLKEGDFRVPKAEKGINIYDPGNIELEDDSVTIIDWLMPVNYAETDKLYCKLVNQLTRHGGLLIVFAQLKKDGSWFAENMIDVFASIAAKYLYMPGQNGEKDNENTYFETCKLRESKVGKQYIQIPTRFDKDSKVLTLRTS